VNWKKLALRLARAIIRYDNHPWSDLGISETTILLAREVVRNREKP
jgi:hypothetical protein